VIRIENKQRREIDMNRSAAIYATTGVLLVLPSVLMAVEMTDYKFPDSQFQEAYIRANMDSQRGNQDQTSYSYNVNGDYESFYSTLPRTWQVNIDGNANGVRGPNDGDDLDDAGSASLRAVVNNYLNNEDKWFWYGSGEADYVSDAEDTFYKVGAGMGYGRVYNATPLAKALRMMEELGDSGLVQPLSIADKTYIDLAQVIDKEAEFRSKYGEEEYRPYWFAAIEEILVRDNVITGGKLDAKSTLILDRVLVDEKHSARKHGWLVSAGVGLVIQDLSGNSDNDPSLDLLFEYAKPFGHRAQFDNILSYSTIFGSDTDQTVRNTMGYTYELTDRVDWVNNWNLTYSIPGDNNLEETVTNILASGFDYYITNVITAGVQITLSHVEDNISGNNNSEAELGTAFSIKYRLL
jgi:hypothetical protein